MIELGKLYVVSDGTTQMLGRVERIIQADVRPKLSDYVDLLMEDIESIRGDRPFYRAIVYNQDGDYVVIPVTEKYTFIKAWLV